MHPVGPVGDGLAVEQVRSEVAEVLPAGRAIVALAAGGDEHDDDVVSLDDVGHAFAELLNDPGALVPAEDGEDAVGHSSTLSALVRHAVNSASA